MVAVVIGVGMGAKGCKEWKCRGELRNRVLGWTQGAWVINPKCVCVTLYGAGSPFQEDV